MEAVVYCLKLITVKKGVGGFLREFFGGLRGGCCGFKEESVCLGESGRIWDGVLAKYRLIDHQVNYKP